MKKWKYVALVASLLAISHAALADNRGNQFVAGIITGAILTSVSQQTVGYNPPPPRVYYREVPRQVIYYVPAPGGGYTRFMVDMQEDAYWAGYRAAHRDAWRGHEYGYGYRRYRDPYDD